jgi:predicted NAD/FAD-dependent oxidoreductase
MSDSSPVLIVGAGISGLTCALELHRAGRAVQLLEAAPAVGGRVRSTVQDGLRMDHGFQVLFTAYPTLRQYLDLEALALRPFTPGARIARGGRVDLIGDALRAPDLLLPTILARGVSVPDKLRLLALRHFARQLSIDECFAAPYDAMSTREFLLSRGFGTSVIDGFFAPFYGGILLDRTLGTRASVLLFTFKMLAEGDTVVPAEGMGAIPRQLAAQLPPEAIRTETRVVALRAAEGRMTGVQLADGSALDVAQVVIATEAPVAAELAATIGVQWAVPPGARGCTTLYYTARRSPIPGRALWLNADAGAVVSHAITLTDVAPSYATEGRVLVAATALGDAADLPDETLDAAARAELLRMGGMEASAAGLERVGLWRVPYSQFAQPPGWTALLPEDPSAPVGLWRASEVLHSSSLEGAARGGVLAARAVLAQH